MADRKDGLAPMFYTRRLLLIIVVSLALVVSIGSASAAVHRVPQYGGGGGGGHDHGHGHGGYWGHGGYYGGYYPYYGYGYPYFAFYGYYGPYGYYGGPYYGYYGPSPYYPGEPDYAVVDCDVDPEEAKVYLDGERLGEADDFDGFPQYLTIPTGHHVLEFRRHGYQTLRIELDAKPGVYYDVYRKLYAGDINGNPRIEHWGGPPRGQDQEQDEDAPPPPRTRTHHYNEKPQPPKPAGPKSNPDNGDDTSAPNTRSAEARPDPGKPGAQP